MLTNVNTFLLTFVNERNHLGSNVVFTWYYQKTRALYTIYKKAIGMQAMK